MYVLVLLKANELDMVIKKLFFPRHKGYLCICSLRLRVIQGQ